jgi:hypothetical protein
MELNKQVMGSMAIFVVFNIPANTYTGPNHI